MSFEFKLKGENIKNGLERSQYIPLSDLRVIATENHGIGIQCWSKHEWKRKGKKRIWSKPSKITGAIFKINGEGYIDWEFKVPAFIYPGDTLYINHNNPKKILAKYETKMKCWD